ncbi:uncharacterized protein LOC130933375 isoform X2 [Arachis stenosperma]|uniref:uncharacterized protein LOC130933375 isoform X2 n=1 Tax=Arachis stenosperma TaxID=217475 RepID=UPI0025AB66CD|nr:uncharacterized protein LOC130933375 isoform X2 [Arachis stenosperma]
MSWHHRVWMYDRLNPTRGGIKPEFYDKVEDFIETISKLDVVKSEGKCRCPCVKCRCTNYKELNIIKMHLWEKGFMPNYWIWTEHGEIDDIGINQMGFNNCGEGGSGSGANVEECDMYDISWEDNSRRYHEMVFDSAGPEDPHVEAKNFFDLLEAAQKPLWEGCVHSQLSIAVRMLCIKAEGNQSQESFKQWTTLIREIAPEGSAIPRDYYEAKKLVQKLGLKAIKIDCCSNNCMLYRKDDAVLTSCKFCEAPRFKPISDGGCKSKRVPVRRMHYLPLIPRLRRLYASMSSAPHMTWHIKNQRDDGVMTHPSHGEAWKSFDRIHSDFALEPRNIRLGLCSDGFTPNIQFSKPYSCWPVIVIPYNLPPGMCMKDPYLFLTCLIPGPNNPKANIDVFLGPLIDELNELWNPGVLTYDIVEKKNFVLKAALMWTINDFPAYGMLSGWMTQGRLSCLICMEDTKSFTLSHGGKASWFDCHRRFLPINHPYRRNKNDFRKNKIESEEAPTRLSGLEIWQRVKGLGKISDNGKWIKSREYGITHNWTKQSVFWELPYWKDNLVRHCLDVMHIEKNVLDNIMNTVMDTDRTKDNEKARLDLAELCKRPDLHLRHVGDNYWSKPKAAYTLTSEQQQDVYKWVQQLRFPDGYASNLARCVSLSQERFIGMKSHDCHIFMQCLLPIAFRELPTNIWKPLTELSQFFKDLCSTTLKVHDLEVMEQNIPIILCKLERIFPRDSLM